MSILQQNSRDAQRHALAANGRGFQPEFLYFLSEQGIDLAIEQLRKHQVPGPVISLLESAIMLREYADNLTAGTLDDTEAIDISDTVPEMTRAIWEMGGEFAGKEIVYRKE